MDEYFLIDQKRWLKQAISWRRMRRLDRHPIPSAEGELRLYTAIRNEMLRLPYFLEYYRGLGVRRFFVVDNDSDDGTTAFLLKQPDVHVWLTRENYDRQEAWIDALLRRYGRDRWCVLVDVDELLVWPGQGSLPLGSLLDGFDREGADAMHALLLDMYPERALKDAAYAAGEPFLSAASWFDPATHRAVAFPYRNCVTDFPRRYIGGVRERVFGLEGICLSKFPLVRFRRGLFVRRGTHAVEGAHFAKARGCLLHFKYLSDFGPRVQYEAERGAHWNGAVQYKAYAQKVDQDSELSFRTADSAQYRDAAQLTELGIMSAG
ncbi:MAG: glycosyltransferase family 2 protein [Verrucomicrobia bacterium]|nr:glycosyltransferase family 2 protein [Verrucomicrobiota bacterium]